MSLGADPAADRPAAGERAAAQPVSGESANSGAAAGKRPLYPRLLQLRHVHPNGWQRAALGEGALALAAVLVLADLASAWTLLALPLGVAVVVKAHDVLAGLLGAGPAGPAGSAGPGETDGPDKRGPDVPAI